MKKLLLILSLVFSINAFSQVPSYVPSAGLVGWWPFNGNAIDSSGNGNNGVVNGPILTTDRFSNPNSAYQFNRSAAQSIDIMNNAVLDSITELTLSIWYNIQSYNDPSSCCGYNHFINKSDQSSQNHFLFAGNNTGLYFYYDNTSAFQTNTLTSLNQWNNAVLTYDYNGGPASMCRIYLNGVLTNSFPTTSQLVSSNFNLRFGTYGSNSYNTVDGTIDDIGIWNRALTPCEINALYQSGASSITVNASSSTICSGLPTTLTASGASSYTWMPGSLSGNSVVVTPSTTTTYTITGTDGLGCTSTTTSLVNVTLPPTTTASAQTNVSCNGLSNGSATIAAAGGTPGYTYSWSPSGGTGATASALSAGSYTCSVTDANSCTAEQSFVITQPNALMATSSSTAIFCNGGSSTITVNAMDGTAPYTGTGTYTASAGTYAYPVTDANGCSTSTTGTITEPAAITGIQSPSICVGENYQVGTSTYTTFGTYTDILTAFNGCDSTVTTNLTVNSLPSLSVAAADTNVCISSSAVSLIALPLGGTWTGAGIVGSTFSPSIAAAGTHIITYTYTDINACANTAQITMVVNLCTGINAASNTASFTVYPNPTNSTLTINTSLNYSSIQIINMLGQVVFTKEKSTLLNLSSLPSGIYFIQLVDTKGSVIGKEKFVKE